MLQRIGRYEILEEIGSGNYGRVYRARMKGAHGFEKTVALKILNTTVGEHNRKEVRALINEARIGGFLKYSGIVDTYEFGEDEGKLFIAMEYVEGITLGKLIRFLRRGDRYLPVSLVVEIGYSVASSLAYAHERQDEESNEPLALVHRDLKPENIMLSTSGELKILDFGIAVSAANLFRTTMKNMTKGTPAYMSPEQVMGVPDLDARSDLFGLGTVMVEMLTTDQLFEGGSWTDTMESVLRKNIAPTLKWIAMSSPELAELLEKMLQRDRTLRISSAREIARELMKLRVRYPLGMTPAECMAAVDEENWDLFPPDYLAARDWQAPDAMDLSPLDLSPQFLTKPEVDLPADPTLSDLLSRQVDELLASRKPDPSGGRRLKTPASNQSPGSPRPKEKHRSGEPSSSQGKGDKTGTSSPALSDPSLRKPSRPSSEPTTPRGGIPAAPRPEYPAAGSARVDTLPPPRPSYLHQGTITTTLRQRNIVAALFVLQAAALVVMAVSLVWMSTSRGSWESGAESGVGQAAGERVLYLETSPWCVVSADGKNLGQTPLLGVALPEGVTSISLACPDAEVTGRTFTVPPTGLAQMGCWNMDENRCCQQ